MKFDKDKIRTNETEPEVPIKILRKIVYNFKDKPDTYRLGFVYLMTALFPTVYDNIMSYCKDCYMQGFMDGKESTKNES